MRAIVLFRSTIIAASLLSCIAAQAATEAANLDNRLVGEWQGQRETKGCKFQSRSVSRMPDGKFVISYYSDPAKTQKTGESKGMWWAADKTLYMQAPNGNKPEAYHYYVIDKNTVRLENVDMDLSAECVGDSTLIDNRVVQQDE